MHSNMIGPKQFMLLTTMYIVSYAILLVPEFLALHAKQQAWQVVIVGTFCTMLVSYLLTLLFKKHPSLSLFELMDRILGRYISFILIVILLWIISLIALSSLLNFIEGFITTQIMPETPAWTFAIMFMLVVVVGTQIGLRALGKAGEILFYIFNLLFFTLIISIIPLMTKDPIGIKLTPMFEVDWKLMLYSLWNYCGITAFPLIALFATFPKYLNKPEQARRMLMWSSVLGSIYLLIIVIGCLMIMGYEMTGMTIYPSYILAQRVNIGNFFTRIEILMAASWFITIYIKLIFYFKFSVRGLAHLIRIDNFRILSLPFSITPLILSFYVFRNFDYLLEWENTVWPIISLVFLFGTPLLLLIVGKIRRIV